MVNEQIEYKEHEINWTDEKVSRLWDYYSRTPPYSEMYFSKSFGHHILRKSGLPLEAKLDVLDFGCGPGFIWDHLRQLNSNWQYTALDFSETSVSKVTAKASGDGRFSGAEHVRSLPTKLASSKFDIVYFLKSLSI